MGSSRNEIFSSEKLEIIHTVFASASTKQTLDMLGIPPHDLLPLVRLVSCWVALMGCMKAFTGSVWNRIPDTRRDNLIEFALEHEALSTRELAVKYTDEKLILYLNRQLTAF